MYARRTVLKGALALPLAAVLANPKLAAAVAASLSEVSLITACGQAVKGALALPAATPAAAVLLVHEWWGLNDQIKSVAAALAKQGYIALAVDLYDGNVATTRADARAYMSAMRPAAATDTLASWIGWLDRRADSTGRTATIGWCFGGGWSLNAALAAPVGTNVAATVVYYGNVAKSADQLAPLNGPVLGHFATRDRWINRTMVDGFDAAMQQAGKRLDAHWYDADHAFANPTSARYDAADAALAWQRTLAFLRANL